MKATIKVKQEIDIKTVLIKANVRYWEDAIINGIVDTEGVLTPCRVGDLWCPEINIDTGVIINWTRGVTAGIHFKVCDAGSYYLKDAGGNVVVSRENEYVPNELIPDQFGDYIIMNIDENGKIAEWEPSLDDFEIE